MSLYSQLFLRETGSPYGDITRNSTLSFKDLDQNFIFLKERDINQLRVDGSNLIYETLGGTEYSVNIGGTATGDTNTFVTGFTFNSPSLYKLTISQNEGEPPLTVDLSSLASDVYVLSGAYDPSTGDVEFTNSTGGTFVVSGFTTGMTDSYTDAATLNGNTIEFDNNIQGSNFYNVDLTPVISGFTTGNTLQETLDTGSIATGISTLVKIVTSNQLDLTSTDGGSNFAYLRTVNNNDLTFSAANASAGGEISLNPTLSYFKYNNTSGEQQASFNGTAMTITDTINTKGLEYNADYSTNFVNESLITKRYVDNSVSGKVSTTLFNTYTGDTETVLGTKVSTASNIGGGEGLFSGKSGTDLQFKSLTSTGGTVTISTTGATVNLESAADSNFYVTGFTYNDANTLTISRNGGLGDLSATINTLTGLTINGELDVTGDVGIGISPSSGWGLLVYKDTTTSAGGGISSTISHDGTGTLGNLNSLDGNVQATSSGTITSARGVSSKGVIAAGTSTIVNAYNFYGFSHNESGGSITNSYGLYLEPQTVGTTNWGIYQAGTEKNYFGGQLQLNTIGTGTSVTNLGVDASGNVVSGTTGGDVSKVGTPVNNQIGVWTGDGTLEGDTGLTWNTAQIEVTDTDNNLTEIRADWVRVYNETDDANLFLYGYGTGHRGEIVLGAANGDRTTPTATLNGNNVATISAFGHSGTGFRQGGHISFAATENYTEGTNYGTRFVIQTVADGSTSLVTRYATDGDGNHDFTGDVSITGDVGIGTTIPQEKLHVSTGNDLNSGNISFLIGGTAGTNARTGRIIKNTSSPYEMTIRASDFATGSNLLLNDTGGNVGIGTTSPTEALDVSGNTVMSGTLNIGTIGGTTSVTNLGIDSSGNVVSGSTGGGSVSFGSNTQIPFTNGTSDDFDYDSKLSYIGSTLYSQSTSASSPGIRVDRTTGSNNTKIFGGSLSGTLDSIDWSLNRAGATAMVLQTTNSTGVILATNNAGASGTGKVFHLRNTGNIDIGQGYNVTGLGARVGIKGEGTTSATSGLKVVNSADATTFEVKDDGTINIPNIGSTTSVTNLGVDASGNVVSGTTGGGGGVSFGSNTQIPFTNGTSDDFDYDTDFTYNGTTLKIIGTGNQDLLSLYSSGSSTTNFFNVIARGDVTGAINGLGYKISRISTTSVAFGSTSNHPLTLFTNNNTTSNLFTLFQSGNVKIGDDSTTDDGSSKLYIRSDSDLAAGSNLKLVNNSENTLFEVKNDGTINIPNVGTGTSVTNLGVDASGNVVSGTTGGGGGSGLNYISAGAVATNLENTSNWDINGVYTGATATGSQADCHVDSNYWFTCVATDTWIRLIRG